MGKKHFTIKLFVSLGLTMIGFLVSLAVFSMVYKTHIYKPYPEAQKISWEIRRVNFIAVGDIMLSRLVARQTEKEKNPSWVWANISDFLHSSDFNFWNLESPTNGTNIYSYEKVLIFNALPDLLRTLPEMNFWIINLANNHALDQGEQGLKTTQTLLREIGIEQVGTGKNSEEAWTAKIIEKNGIKIAFLGASYASYNDDGTQISPMIARMQNSDRIKRSVKNARTEADFVVVSMHGGLEYTRDPTPLQIEFAHAAIDAGADIIIGAHPHWTQKIESYRGKYIFYSLGNFVFDQEFSPETKTGLTLRVLLEKNNNTLTDLHIELHPILIEHYGQPRLLSWEAKIQSLRDINQYTDILN